MNLDTDLKVCTVNVIIAVKKDRMGQGGNVESLYV
jgi:hypothetical protein